MPIAVRSPHDAYSPTPGLWPVDAKGLPLKATSYMAPGFPLDNTVTTNAAVSRSGWLWLVDAKGHQLKDTSDMDVGVYVAKYVNKKSDMDLAAKGLGAKEWNNSLKTKLSLLPKKLFRIRMSRNFVMKM